MSREPGIFTLTGNLLAERTLEFDAWVPGRTQRARRESFQVGGKGINVSKMLNRLGVANTALYFAGGASGRECEDWLVRHRFRGVVFRTQTSTRVGTVVRAPGQPETTFLGPDAAPDPAAVCAGADFLDAQAGGDVLAVCGSFPGWSTAEFGPLRAALERWRHRGSLVVDTYGPALAWFAERSVALIKINADEYQPLIAAGKVAAQAMIVTDGPRPVRWRDADQPWQTIHPPQVTEVSPTGSGDVLLACVLDARFRRGVPLGDAIAWSLPFAAANAAHSGVAEFPEPEASR